MNNSIVEEMKEFCAKFNLSAMDASSSSLSLESVVAFQESGLRGKTTEEIEDFIFKTHAFVTILKNKHSSLSAFCVGMDSRVNKYVHNNLDQVDKYLPYNAKRDAIISMDKTVSAMDENLSMAKMQLEKIGRLPDGIDATLRSLENYLRRRHSNGN